MDTLSRPIQKMTPMKEAASRTSSDQAWLDEEPEQQAPVRPLSRDEAQALLAQQPSLSPWRVLGWQALAGIGVALVAGLLTHRSSVVLSALYGAAAIVLPGLLLARGMTKPAGAQPGAAVLRFMFWEFVKIAVAVTMLVTAAKVVPDLSWPALLVAMIVCMKTSWVALLRQRPVKRNV